MIENIFRYLLIPSNVITLFFLLSLILLLSNKLLFVAKTSLIAGMLLYFILGSGPVSFWLMKQLEYKYPPVSNYAQVDEINNIVVLAGFGEYITDRPVTANIYPAAAYRILEATRLYNSSNEQANIIITGEGESVHVMKKVFESIGVPSEKLVIDESSKDTIDSAIYVNSLLNDQPFYLVTSAGHMPRAAEAFAKRSLTFTPAPTHYLSKENILATAYFPTPSHFYISDTAIFEYFARLKDQLVN